MTQDFTFAPAVRRQKRLRIALEGPAGSGKTATALRIARALFPEGRIALIDTEGGSAAAYAANESEDESMDALRFRFSHLVLRSYSPETYVRAIEAAERQGFDIIIVDSLSHAWAGKDGALEQVDRAATRQDRGGNKWGAWADVTPMQNRLVDTILQSSVHIIATMRVAVEWEVIDRNGKKVPQKVGTKPVQRESMEYEFDVIGSIDTDHELDITKSRCQALDGAHFRYPGEDVAEVLTSWLADGAPALRSPRELMAELNAGFARAGIDQDSMTPEVRLKRAGHLTEILGTRPSEEAIVDWLHHHDDDVELLLAAVCSRMGIEVVPVGSERAPSDETEKSEPAVDAPAPEATEEPQEGATPPEPDAAPNGTAKKRRGEPTPPQPREEPLPAEAVTP